MRSILRVASTALTILLFTSFAHAGPISGFNGVYDVTTWTTQLAAATTNTTVSGTVGTGGSVNTSGGPLSISMYEPDNGGGSNYEVQFLNTAAGDGLFSFDWAISGNDFCCGSANVYIGDTAATGWSGWSTDPTDVLWSNSPGISSGSFSGAISAGQAFGFGVATADDCCGAIILTITNFSAPGAVPEPVPLTLLAAGLVVLGLRRRSLKKAA